MRQCEATIDLCAFLTRNRTVAPARHRNDILQREEIVLGMSDRIMVIHEGSVTGFLARDEADQVKIMELASH